MRANLLHVEYTLIENSLQSTERQLKGHFIPQKVWKKIVMNVFFRKVPGDHIWISSMKETFFSKTTDCCFSKRYNSVFNLLWLQERHQSGKR